MPERVLWGLQWRSVNRRDGEQSHLLNDQFIPVLFRTRAEARQYAEAEYGYIKHRPDLRGEPHGWRMPRPVRVRVTMEAPNA